MWRRPSPSELVLPLTSALACAPRRMSCGSTLQFGRDDGARRRLCWRSFSAFTASKKRAVFLTMCRQPSSDAGTTIGPEISASSGIGGAATRGSLGPGRMETISSSSGRGSGGAASWCPALRRAQCPRGGTGMSCRMHALRNPTSDTPRSAASRIIGVSHTLL